MLSREQLLSASLSVCRGTYPLHDSRIGDRWTIPFKLMKVVKLRAIRVIPRGD